MPLSLGKGIWRRDVQRQPSGHRLSANSALKAITPELPPLISCPLHLQRICRTTIRTAQTGLRRQFFFFYHSALISFVALHTTRSGSMHARFAACFVRSILNFKMLTFDKTNLLKKSILLTNPAPEHTDPPHRPAPSEKKTPFNTFQHRHIQVCIQRTFVLLTSVK